MIPGDEIGGRIVSELGLDVLDPPGGRSGQFSLEEIDTLLGAADMILAYDYGGNADLESNPLFAQLPAVVAGGYVTVPTDVATAVYQESTLSVRWAAPLIADALLHAAETRSS
jgi:ABC-type Fe3+-hydroxamate transport system substrate-binding protein